MHPGYYRSFNVHLGQIISFYITILALFFQDLLSFNVYDSFFVPNVCNMLIRKLFSDSYQAILALIFVFQVLWDFFSYELAPSIWAMQSKKTFYPELSFFSSHLHEYHIEISKYLFIYASCGTFLVRTFSLYKFLHYFLQVHIDDN